MAEKDKKSTVFYLSDPNNHGFNEKLYIELRKKEHRLYTNEDLRLLPYVQINHHHIKEWKVRKRSAEKLVQYISRRKDLSILEVGCGNGWLSNLLSEKTNNNFTALDLNKTELEQAAEIFPGNRRLIFVYGNIFENIFDPENFDIIVLAASVQYFEDLDKLIKQLFHYLKKDGEVHILDSYFYNENQINEARVRTKNYYNSIGIPGMIEYYHHHGLNKLSNYNYKILNRISFFISSIIRKLTGSGRNVFPWILIRKG
ncbi:MAG TPA: methyltransferase domain-containing protein [Ignavibacteriaceae bacterium]|nr:methyltransferase domain-containing protein [Ignavibacteriaceae bacterium]